MAGNVWEWVEDWYEIDDWYEEGKERVLRGGSWKVGAAVLQATHRITYRPERRDITWGFRLSRDHIA